MEQILKQKLSPSEAALWWLGQAGYIVRVDGLTIVIDPYLSNSAASGSPEFTRKFPPPINPEELYADIYIITHDHLDHLDPDTLSGYKRKNETWFIAPRLATKKLILLGIPKERIAILNAGETWSHDSIQVTGHFAIPTGVDVLDTTGYAIRFSNGRSLYHTSDTEFHPLVLAAAPREPEIMLVPINGKWGNPNPEQAAQFALEVQPMYVFPNHYDLMALNGENPESFKWFCENIGLYNRCIIPELLHPFIWSSEIGRGIM